MTIQRQEEQADHRGVISTCGALTLAHPKFGSLPTCLAENNEKTTTKPHIFSLKVLSLML